MRPAMGATAQPLAAGGSQYGRLRPQPEFMRLFQQLKQLKAQERPLGKDGIKAAPLDKFTGEKVGKTTGLREWLQRYYGNPGQPSVQSLSTYFTKTASSWFTTQSSLRQSVWTLDELVGALAIRFDDQSSAITARAELRSLKQGREDIVTFNQRFLEMATAANAASDADIIARYSGAVNTATLQVITTNKWHRSDLRTTLPDLMAMVQEEVQAADEFAARIRSVSDGTSYAKGYGVSYREPIVTGDPMELGNMRMQQQGANGQCFRCHGFGHWADRCATPEDADDWRMQLQCHKCKGWGHKQADCNSQEQQQPRPKSPRPGQQQRQSYKPPHQRAQSPRQQPRSPARSPKAGQQPGSPARWQKGDAQSGAGFKNLRNYRPRNQGRGNAEN
jgi:hypothetical protein